MALGRLWQTITRLGVRTSDRQRLEEFEVGRVDLRAELLAVGFGHAFLEERVQVLVGLEHRAVGPLRQLVVAGNEVNLSRELALERREEIDELVRLVPAPG